MVDRHHHRPSAGFEEQWPEKACLRRLSSEEIVGGEAEVKVEKEVEEEEENNESNTRKQKKRKRGNKAKNEKDRKVCPKEA